MKKKILMVCEAFGGGVFTYVSQLCNDMTEYFDVYLAYSLRPQTPKNYKEFIMDSPLFFICSKLYYTEVVSAVILYKADLFADL